MNKERTIVPGEIEGFLSGCPFCTSLRIGIPEIGTRFRIIYGLNTGATGTVVEWPQTFPKFDYEFMAQLDHEPKECLSIVSIKRQRIQKLPIPKAPSWAPPLDIENSGALDEKIVKFCERSFWKGKWKIDWNSFYNVIATIWDRQLPVEANELWLVLQAHGVPENSKRTLLAFYKKGRELLIFTIGKKPFKSRKRPPLSL